LWQFLIPDIAEKYSTWNLSKGWQREIALWNLSVDLAIIITLAKKDIKYAEILTFMATVLCFLLGSNHFISAITATKGILFCTGWERLRCFLGVQALG
jgi:hypothetical protein